MKESIVAVIPTYNQKKDVKEAIDSLLNQTVPLKEIIVIDNASPDDTAQYLKNSIKNNKVTVIENKKNLGVTGGRNTGIKYATGADYILFFDHDMVAEPQMVEELLKSMKAHKNIGIVTPKIYYWDNKKIIWSAGTDINLTTGQTLFRGGEDKGQYDKGEEVAVAPAVLLVKKDVIEKIKQFDSIYFATYEDTDFCFRAKNKGYITFFTPKAIAYHKIPFDEDLSNRRLLERAYWVGRNRMIFMRRFGNNFLLFLLISPVFVAYYLVLSLRYKKPYAFLHFVRGSILGLFT
jgi:GT2 family glycosyltransferase